MSDDPAAVRRWSLAPPRGTTPQAERVDQLLTTDGLRIERIESQGHHAPSEAAAWFDQDEDEWVMVLTGSGRLMIEGEAEEIALGSGDAVWLPAHTRHRVTWTDPDQATVWVAVFSRHHPER